MKVVKYLGLALVVFAGAVYADGAEIVSVKGRGVGVDETAALKDAYRDAVETAVGMFVDAEQMVKNDEVIKDQILTQSNAYIEKYDMISKSEKDGLVCIKIIAKVRKQALTKRIEGVMPAKVVNIGDQLSSLHAQATTQKMRGTDAAALFVKELEELDKLKLLYEAELVSAEGVPEDVENGIPKSRNGIIEMEYLFKISIDTKRYFEEVVPRLDRILTQISLEEPKTIRCKVEFASRGNPTFLAGGESLQVRRSRVAPFLGYSDSGTAEGFRVDFGASERGRLGSLIDGHSLTLTKEPRVVRLITQANDALTVVRAKRYVLDGECVAAYVKWASRGEQWMKPSKRETFCPYLVTFVDGSGQPMSETEIQFADSLDAARSLVCERLEVCWEIMPWFGRSQKARSYYRWFTFKLPKDDLPKIKSIKVEVAN